MCVSAQADVAAAVVLAGVGVSTLDRVHARRDLLVGALPALFAVHQLLESVVWLGLRGQVPSAVGDAACDAYVTYAYAILPAMVPVGFLALEREPAHRRRLRPFVALGAGVGAAFLRGIVRRPVDAVAHARGIAYDTHTPDAYALAVAYAAATCLPALLSSQPHLRWLGVVNVVAAGVATTVHRAEFTSVWCLYAALASVLVREHFRQEEVARASAPDGTVAVLRGSWRSAGRRRGRSAGADRDRRRPPEASGLRGWRRPFRLVTSHA